MNNRQVAHIWAQQSGRDARGSHYFSDGPSIYSYGRHFLIARFVERKGKRAVLFTTRDHSVTTQRHKSITRGALYGLGVPVFKVRDPSAVSVTAHAENRERYQTDIAHAMAQAARARKYAGLHVESAERLTAEANSYAEFFGLRWRLKMPASNGEAIAALRETIKRQTAANAAMQRKREALKAAEYAERLTRWRAGENVSCHFAGMGSDPGAALRVRGDTVETSRGAEVPVSDARRAVEFVALQRAHGHPWQRNGARLRVGAFDIDKISADGDVHAGCHFIKWEEVERLAVALGVTV